MTGQRRYGGSGCGCSQAGQKLAPRNPLRNIAFHAVLPETAASTEALLRAIAALLIKGFAHNPTLRTKPNMT
jgi:hypothetical protein